MAGVVLQSEEAIMATANEPRHIQKIVAKMDWSEQFGPTQRTLQLEKTTSVKLHDDSSLEPKPGITRMDSTQIVLKFAQMDGRQEAEIISYMVQVTAKKRDNMEFKDQTTSRSMLEGSMELKLSNHRKKRDLSITPPLKQMAKQAISSKIIIEVNPKGLVMEIRDSGSDVQKMWEINEQGYWNWQSR